ncbi:MAG TPA: sensor histidine kinase [Campylobacterales bacterium]|nr:sensor histidine kinase [Campylobacterales bacterium]HHS92113.1 sensor histidine kinase [Campylobacterales bacterium]
MFKKIKEIHYKELFLYGFYLSYIGLTSLATIIDFMIENYDDALIDFISVLFAAGSFWFYLKSKNFELASIALFWIASGVILLFVIQNEFDISIIFTLLIPMVAFILLSTKKVVLHVGIYFFLLAIVFLYGYTEFDSHPLLYQAKHISAYIIAMLFVIAFGIFYHIAIEHSYQALESANRQKTFLLKEIHHRVKNNLNIIASILGIQKFETDSKEVHELIEQNRLRLESMAMAHEILYQQDSLANIDFELYMKKLTAHILKTESHGDTIEMQIKIMPLALNIETMIQFGLMVNELMTNSIKYAFENQSGVISIMLSQQEEGYLFIYEDNGQGFDINHTQNGFGSSLIGMVVEQLEGELHLSSSHGVRYEILFKGLKSEDTNC